MISLCSADSLVRAARGTSSRFFLSSTPPGASPRSRTVCGRSTLNFPVAHVPPNQPDGRKLVQKIICARRRNDFEVPCQNDRNPAAGGLEPIPFREDALF